jgi:hypothetical protein
VAIGGLGKAPSTEVLKELSAVGLKPADAREVSSAIEEGISVLTRDDRILKKVPGVAHGF